MSGVGNFSAGAIFWRDPDNLEKLRKAWLAGVAPRDIAKAMKISVHAVVGKAHRLNLPVHVTARGLSTVKASDVIEPNKEIPPQVLARRINGDGALPPFHPIAADVLRGAGLWAP